MSAADAAGNETEAAVREVKPSTPRSILRRDVPASSTAVEGATRKRVTFEVRGMERASYVFFEFGRRAARECVARDPAAVLATFEGW